MTNSKDNALGRVSVKLADVPNLPPTLPVWHRTETSAASLLGLGRSPAYAMAQRGTIPTVRLGPGRIVVPTTALLRLLGIDLGTVA